MKKIDWLLALGTVCLWLAFSPEILLKAGMGCLKRADGMEITKEEASEVLDWLLFPSEFEDDIVIHTRSKFLEWMWNKNDE